MMDPGGLTVPQVSSVKGTLRVPPDKSICHRALILSAMSSGPCRIEGLAPGADVRSTGEALRALGVDIVVNDGAAHVGGNGWKLTGGAALDAENSATTMRLLAGALSGVAGEFTITGDPSLRRRPMGRVADPLRRMGAEVLTSEGDVPPLTIRGGDLRGIHHEMDVASAQVKTAVILAGLQASGRTEVVEPQPSRDHTERMLAWLGADVAAAGREVAVGEEARLPLQEFQLLVPGDFSSAAFAIVAACLAGGDLLVEDVGLNPTRTGLLEILAKMGASIETEPLGNGPEPAGRVRVRSSPLRGVRVPAEMVGATIDELPLIAVLGTAAEGETVVEGAAELRVKEADRIAVLVEQLRVLGADIEAFPDGFVVRGPTRLTGGTVDPRGDHRLAMTFAAAGFIAAGPVTVLGWDCTAVSYPGFLDDLGPLLS